MKDLLPSESPLWQYLESTIAKTLANYAYREIRFPLLENSALFKRSIGEVTDIVEKEMYTFADRNGELLSLRPEGTASCVRACEEHQLLYNRGTLTQKLWYAGPMFRHEKPQKGRLRQFHQVGVEAFGMAGPDIDAELMIMTARLWRELGIDQHVTLQINSLGTASARQAYRTALCEYLGQHHDQLDEDSQRRLTRNPLRVLDSKVEQTQAILADAPDLHDFLDPESQEHFATLQALLRAVGVPFEVNSRMVRGLDYYGKTVFEWVSNKLGSQSAICAGGRYDGLVEQLGGKPTPAVGFAMGLERLVILLQTLGHAADKNQQKVDIYLAAVGDVLPSAFALCERIRTARPDIALQMHCGGGNFKNQLKKADKSGADIVLIIGENEAKAGQVTLKHLRGDTAQQTVDQTEVVSFLAP